MKTFLRRIPGALMIVPLMLGAIMNTIDQAHLPAIESALQWLGAPPTASGNYEFLRIGGFTEALFKSGALTLIALFLFCAASQMNLRVGGRALKKGVVITAAKYLTGLAVGFLFGWLFDPMHGFLGLSTLAIIAAMTNSNGGMYVALTGAHGNRSDVGAIAVLSLNDGPFFTLLSLGLMGAHFPVIAFLAVLIPVALGMLLGNVDPDSRAFLAPGERIIIPFFAFALGAGMNFAVFLDVQVLGAGLTLGLLTTILTGATGVLALRLAGERSQIAAAAEASTAGNAVATPAAIAAAAGIAASTGMMPAEEAAGYVEILNLATAQISISTLFTAILCPIAVIFWEKHQLARGIDGRLES